ncbi:DUF6491 family protein [Sphingopyxis sp. PET50]|uniref:DUF6491 family protein n=1 Tax=Sphingopyxis sp. PET50 TaxID=2976533 RepID=UPI0021AE9865|nr:DUF6491 family protein [Sphingopyxis sp. PET50]
MKQKLALSLAALLLPLSAAAADEPAPKSAAAPREIGVEASIAFPAYGTVRNFEADGDDGVWIEDQRRDWYYAKLTGYCPDLDFVQSIGIDTRGTSRLDKFGAIIVKGQRCAITSFVTAEKPLPRKERLKLAKEAKEAAKASDSN